MTNPQIEKVLDLARAEFRKHASEFDSQAAQIVLGQGDLAKAMIAVFRERVEKISNMIVRRVKVDRTRTPQQVIDAIDRGKYVDPDVPATMPRGEGEEVEVHFLKLDRYMSPTEVERLLDEYGLKPDPYAVAQVNIDDPEFADEHPNATQWDVRDGQSSCVAFSRWSVGRRVSVSRHGRGWNDSWWVAGVRK